MNRVEVSTFNGQLQYETVLYCVNQKGVSKTRSTLTCYHANYTRRAYMISNSSYQYCELTSATASLRLLVSSFGPFL
jgi:hypothetical protein